MPIWEQLATDQFDPWQIVPRQVFTSYSRLLISTAFVVVSHVGCLGVNGVLSSHLFFHIKCLGLLMVYDVGFPGNRREIKKYQLGGQDSTQNSSFVCDLAFEVCDSCFRSSKS